MHGVLGTLYKLWELYMSEKLPWHAEEPNVAKKLV